MFHHVSGSALLCLYSGLMFLNVNWLMSSVDPVEASLTNMGLGNLTAVTLEPVRIFCPAGTQPKVEQAISDHVHNSLLAGARAQSGLAFPFFTALFKSDDYKQYIMDVFSEMASLGSTLPRGRATFICIHTEEDALEFQSIVPDLWERCMQRSPLPYQPIDPIAIYETSTLFLCRPFFILADDTEGPAPQQCPSVEENKFTTDDPVRVRFANRATYITTFAINAYSQLPITQSATSYIALLNAALGWSIRTAAGQPWSYILFERCRS